MFQGHSILTILVSIVNGPHEGISLDGLGDIRVSPTSLWIFYGYIDKRKEVLVKLHVWSSLGLDQN